MFNIVFVKKIHHFLGLRIYKDYSDYEVAQKENFKSHEIDVPNWQAGQNRFIDLWLAEYPRDLKILDISCGDGVGLRHFRELEFTNIVGADFEPGKLTIAALSNYPVYQQDFHDLKVFTNETFDIVYSSHSLEHAFNPDLVVKEFWRVLKTNGLLILVLPYPDGGDERAHCAKYKLGTDKADDGQKVCAYIEKFGFKLAAKQFDNYREPEIWLKFIKI